MSRAIPAGWRRQLADGLAGLGQDPDAQERERLLAYLALIRHWNRRHNLTAVDDPERMVTRHLVDSLSIGPWLTGRRMVDAGTGAGLPGVALAIVRPECRFTLVDSSAKKIRFLRQVRRELALDNIEPLHGRVENGDPAGLDCVVARALAPLPRLVEWCRGYLDHGARLLAMKGRLDESECAAVADAYNVERIELDVPGEPARRSLAIIEKK